MRNLEMTDAKWHALLSLRAGGDGSIDPADPVNAVYGPLASSAKPYVLAQVGQSLDGRIATPAGDARDVSGPDGLLHLHRCRALVDAVVVGVSTVKLDDPRLSVRLVEGPDPVRVVIDCQGELTGKEGIFNDSGAPVIVFQSSDAPCRPLANAETVRLRRSASGLAASEIVEALNDRGLTRILVEGGAKTIARFIDAGCIDHLHVAISPVIIGSGPSGICLPPIEKLSSARRPPVNVFGLGSDILYDCDFTSDACSAGESQDVRVTDLA